MTKSISRRTFLKGSSVAIASTAGCIDSSNTIRLILSNDSEEQIDVSTTVTRTSDNEEVLSDTVTIPANEGHTYEDILYKGEKYEFHVSVENGPETSFDYSIADYASNFWIHIDEDKIYEQVAVE